MSGLKRNEIVVDGYSLLLQLFEKYKNEPWVLSDSEIKNKRNSFFPSKWKVYAFRDFSYKYGLKCGIVLDEFRHLIFLYSSNKHLIVDFNKLTLKELNGIFWFDTPKRICFKDKMNASFTSTGEAETLSIEVSSPESKFLKEFLKEFKNHINKKIESAEKKKSNAVKREKERVANLAKRKESSLLVFDKDSNGIVDVIEGADDFLTLFKKHQKAIIEIDKDYIQKFVKTSNYLKTKRRNIQSIFENFQKADTLKDLKNRVGILKNDIHTYEVLLMHSLTMIMALLNEDMITFYEIYETFDKLNVFNSNWENEVSGKLSDISGKLSDIGDGLNQLIYSVNKMNQDIVQELSCLTYTTDVSFEKLKDSVSAELSSINSSIQFGNLLSSIQTYQLYKINKRG